MKKPIKYAFLLALPLALVACDGGGGSGSDSASIQTDGPPSNENAASGQNDSNDLAFTLAGADEALESTYEAEIIALINEARSSLGLPTATLIEDEALSELARGHSAFLETGETNPTQIIVNHVNFQERADSAFALEYTFYAENVAGVRGYAEDEVAEQIVEGWLNSPSHFEAIQDNFTNTGVGVSVDTVSGIIYATQLFTR